MTLAEKFTRLKTSVGGNREKMHFEDTFGMPKANTTLLWRKRWIICWKNSRPRAY